jgi:hypothetical protein
MFADFFRTSLVVTFSDGGARKEQERAAYIHFLDLLEECDGRCTFS